MENNVEKAYYIPKIEELFVGYECERMFYKNGIVHYTASQEEAKEFYKNSEVEWSKETIRWILDYKFPNYDPTKVLRTKYLTKECIESCGWKFIDNSDDGFPNYYQKGDFHMSMKYKNTYKIYKVNFIDPDDYTNPKPSYCGEIKSINELKKLEEWLKI